MNSILNFIWTMGSKWQCWLAVIIVCVGFLTTAVYYQEVLMHYPCELCIYTRVWMVAMALFACVGLAVRKNILLVRVVLAIEILLAIGLTHVSWQLLEIEYGWGGGGACSMVANFPSWARLDDWIPTLFKVQGSCAPTPYVLFKLSMAHGLIGVSVGFLLAFVLGLRGSFKKP